MGRVTYTDASSNYVAAGPGLVGGRTLICSWNISNPRGIKVGPQRPGAKDMILYVSSVAPAHIPAGLCEITCDNHLFQTERTISAFDMAALPVTVIAQQNQDTALTHQSGYKLNFGDNLCIYVTAAVAATAADSVFAIPVMEL